MLTPDEVIDISRTLWKRHRDEVSVHDRAYDFLHAKRGVPDVPEGSGDELQDLAKMAIKNVLAIVVDAFAQNLHVHGFRSPNSDEDDPAWLWWQEQRLDARQAEVVRPALTYGASYAVLVSGQCSLRTPRQLFALYQDPSIDLWPQYALDTWIDRSGEKPVRRGLLLDNEAAYPVDLGSAKSRQIRPTIARDKDGNPEDPAAHSYDVCPVVRFVNARDAEDEVVGEVTPLIPQQLAINNVNFDRLIVSRFGAFPQKYAIGWAASSSSELARVSAARLMAFEDDAVKVGDFAQASVEPYNSILEEMITHVAMEAQIPLSSFGRMANLSADALAMTEAPHQRKLVDKRASFGESWEQLLRLAATARGQQVDDRAEVVWRETEVRSFAQVVDGITKLAAQGVPIEELLADIPGWSKTRVDQIRDAIRQTATRANPGPSTGPTGSPAESTGESAADVKAKADALGVLIRSGVDPEEAAHRVGLDGVKFTGAIPVSLRPPADEAAKLEAKNGDPTAG